MFLYDTNFKIHFRKNKTIVTLIEDGKSTMTTIARCHPDDVFNPVIGVRVTMEKMEKIRNWFYGKAVYIGETNKQYTRGRIYTLNMNKNDSNFKNFVPIVE